MKKKLLAIITVILMVVSLIPVFAFPAMAESQVGKPLCFTAEEPGSIELFKDGSGYDISLEYSTDGKNWLDFSTGWIGVATFERGTIVNFTKAGDKVYFRAKDVNKTFSDSAGASMTTWHYQFVIIDAKVSASGDVTTLLEKNGGVTDLTDTTDGRYWKSCFASLFKDCVGLTTAPELPSTKLTENCYASMFEGCTGLTTAPKLPATELANTCYRQMFYGCSKLTTAPKLPATELKDFCYDMMFAECIALTNAPKLSATTLKNGCYYQMFRNCENLEAIQFQQTVPPSVIDNFTLGSTGFVAEGTKIVVPAESVDDYKAASGWENYKSQIIGAYFINIEETENGTVTADKQYVPVIGATDKTVKLTVTPNEGCKFKSLKYNDGKDHDITSTKEFTMPEKDVTVTAVFEKIVPDTADSNNMILWCVLSLGAVALATGVFIKRKEK